MNRSVEVQARVARALIKMEGMKAENQMKVSKGEYPIYNNEDFENIIINEQIGYNDVIAALREDQ